MKGKYQKNRIFILNDNHALRINIGLAEEIGLNESIVLLQVEYLLSISDNVIDGKNWIYNSAQDMKDKYFGFWSISTIRRTLDSLKTEKLIIEGNYNKKKYDKTKWFTLNLEELDKLKSIKIDKLNQDAQPIVQNEQRSGQNEQSIPKTHTETNQIKLYVASDTEENFTNNEEELKEAEAENIDISFQSEDASSTSKRSSHPASSQIEKQEFFNYFCEKLCLFIVSNKTGEKRYVTSDGIKMKNIFVKQILDESTLQEAKKKVDWFAERVGKNKWLSDNACLRLFIRELPHYTREKIPDKKPATAKGPEERADPEFIAAEKKRFEEEMEKEMDELFGKRN